MNTVVCNSDFRFLDKIRVDVAARNLILHGISVDRSNVCHYEVYVLDPETAKDGILTYDYDELRNEWWGKSSS